MSEPEGQRKRSRRAAAPRVAGAEHYVGYVDDDESPAAIMAKFAALERAQEQTRKDAQSAKKEKEAADDGPGGSSPGAQDDTQLAWEDVLRITSSRSIKSAYFRSRKQQEQSQYVGEDDDWWAEFARPDWPCVCLCISKQQTDSAA